MTVATTPGVLFVGESPPPGAPQNFVPFDCASGTRLARGMLGLVDRATLLQHVPRVNLFDTPTGSFGCPPWDAGRARIAACVIRDASPLDGRPIVLLGSKVAAAFDLGVQTTRPGRMGVHLTAAPHPSGASTKLNTAAALEAVRQSLLPELVVGCATLRPWHFRLDDPAVLHDLAYAVSPFSPAHGAAALEWAASQHKARLAAASTPLLARVRANAWNPGKLAVAVAEVAHICGVVPEWDEPLRRLATILLLPDGPRDLAERWKPDASTSVLWLDRIASKYRATIPPSPHLTRANALRYALAGML